MKHLEFLRAFGQYYYSKVSQVYASSCAFLPMSCQAGLRNIETKVGCYSAPLMEGSERVLVNLDDKVSLNLRRVLEPPTETVFWTCVGWNAVSTAAPGSQ